MSEIKTMNEVQNENGGMNTYELSEAGKRQQMVMSELGVLGELVSITPSYCSFVPKTRKDKTALYNAVNTEKKVKDLINVKFNLAHVYSEVVEIHDKENDELIPAIRTVLIDDKNEGYSCCSKTLFLAIKQLFETFGVPAEWGKPIPIIIKTCGQGEKQFYKITVQ